ncbi:transposase [Nocardia africana]|uniref:transposase n=1 Tax=Nocardia africana TaxID=134964 RepID=UPI002277341E|nr:transposase [Nocardia africana]
MTTLDAVAKKKAEASAEELAVAELVRMAKEQGLSLTGPDGLLKQFTKTVLETALNEEMTEHLGYEPNQAPAERDSPQCAQRNQAEDGADRDDRAGADRGAARPRRQFSTPDRQETPAPADRRR